MKGLLKGGLFTAMAVALALLAGPQIAGAKDNVQMTVEKNTDRLGSDYHGFPMAKPQPNECRKACKADTRCKAYTYVKPGVQGPQARCYLKHSVPPPTPNPCCESGVKK